MDELLQYVDTLKVQRQYDGYSYIRFNTLFINDEEAERVAELLKTLLTDVIKVSSCK